MTKEEGLLLLLEAANEKIGLLLTTNDPERARQKLYSIRREAGDASLTGLQIRISPFPDGELVICKSTIQLEKQEKET